LKTIIYIFKNNYASIDPAIIFTNKATTQVHKDEERYGAFNYNYTESIRPALERASAEDRDSSPAMARSVRSRISRAQGENSTENMANRPFAERLERLSAIDFFISKSL
jgi:hypothetical protein